MELAVSIKLIGKRLCQWDTGRQVKITAADGITVEKVQFAYERECEATTAEHEVQYDGTIIATIPDTMLVTGRNIFAYAVIVLENGGRTRYDQPFSVKPGPKPSCTVDPSDKEEVYSYEALEKRVAELEKGGPGGSSARIGNVTLLAEKWNGEGNLYSQIVTIEGVTENSQVDLTPSVEQLAIFYEKDLAFVTENEGGVVTVYAIGQKPLLDYTIQVTITEVSYE